MNLLFDIIHYILPILIIAFFGWKWYTEKENHTYLFIQYRELLDKKEELDTRLNEARARIVMDEINREDLEDFKGLMN